MHTWRDACGCRPHADLKELRSPSISAHAQHRQSLRKSSVGGCSSVPTHAHARLCYMSRHACSSRGARAGLALSLPRHHAAVRASNIIISTHAQQPDGSSAKRPLCAAAPRALQHLRSACAVAAACSASAAAVSARVFAASTACFSVISWRKRMVGSGRSGEPVRWGEVVSMLRPVDRSNHFETKLMPQEHRRQYRNGQRQRWTCERRGAIVTASWTNCGRNTDRNS